MSRAKQKAEGEAVRQDTAALSREFPPWAGRSQTKAQASERAQQVVGLGGTWGPGGRGPAVSYSAEYQL